MKRFEIVCDARKAGSALIGKYAKCDIISHNGFDGKKAFKQYKITKYAVDTDSNAVILQIELDNNFLVDANTLFDITDIKEY